MELVKIFAIMLSLGLLDSLYINGIGFSRMSGVYEKVQHSRIKIRLFPAFLCYVCLTGLLYYFIVLPENSVLSAFLLGVGVYGVYDFTNYALLTAWPLWMTIADPLWGGTLFATTAFLIQFIA